MTRSIKTGSRPREVPAGSQTRRSTSSWRRWPKARALLLAVSGGPDSTALLLMVRALGAPAADRGSRRRRSTHALRPKAPGRRAAVANLCESLRRSPITRSSGAARSQKRGCRSARARPLRAAGRTREESAAIFVVTAHQFSTIRRRPSSFGLTRGNRHRRPRRMAARSTRDGVTARASAARPLPKPTRRLLRGRGRRLLARRVQRRPPLRAARMPRAAEDPKAEGLDAAALSRLARRAAQVEDALERQTLAAEARLHVIECRRLATRLKTVRRAHGDRSALANPRDRARRQARSPAASGSKRSRRWRRTACEVLARAPSAFQRECRGAHVKCDAKRACGWRGSRRGGGRKLRGSWAICATAPGQRTARSDARSRQLS